MIIDKKTILVTGGTGSLGKVLVRRLLSGGKIGTPKKVIVMSRDESKQHDMRLSYLDKKVSTEEVIYRNFQQALEFRIGDIRSYKDVYSALCGVDIVINAAALKQVPTCEYFPDQAIETNSLGVSNLIRAIREGASQVDTLVGISTDKAAKPINVMGMTKALQERIIISANILNPDTRFICVRYGNVIASRGSVIPLFHHQIENGGPITVTVPKMTRFLLTLNEAVDTIFAALEKADRGEILVPNVPSVTVMNLAKALIGRKDIDIEIIGMRPGEKLHEIMVSDEESNFTCKKGKYYAIKPMLPELIQESYKASLKKEFSSSQNVLNLRETKKLLEKHKLLPGMNKPSEGGELLV
jgi:UDP-glucose 4-epimerase